MIYRLSPPFFRALRLMALGLGVAFGAQALAQTAPPLVQPEAGFWDSGVGFDFGLSKKKQLKVRQSVSGIACNLNASQQRVCLLAFDEGTQARYAVLGQQALLVDAEPVALRPTQDELDAESAATDGHYFYVAGSHSAKRSSCASNPASRHVIRFRLDPKTGRGLRTPEGALVGYGDSGKLWPLMQAVPELAPYVGEEKCLGSESPPGAPTLAGQQGVNIEGMAVRGGQLYFGFRGPVIDGVARILKVDAEALFNPQAGPLPASTLTRLTLGAQRGIRDMVTVKDGFLLLAGPDDSPVSQTLDWRLFWWDGQPAPAGGVVQPKALATLDVSAVKLRSCDKELKPEAITVLKETPQSYQVLVLSDGMCDGGPLVFNVPR